MSGIFRVAAPTNNAPVFSDATLTREVAENSVAGVNVGAVIPAAADADSEDTLTYSMEGTNAASFNFDVSSRQISTKSGVAYDFEDTPSYSVTIRVSDGTDSDTVAVTINVTDVNEPPSAPAAPNVSATSGSTTSLDVSWTAPTNTGKPEILHYDLQYRVNGTTAWINGPQNVMGTSSTITTDLTADTLYDVQVRATNAEGDSGFSEAGTGSTNALGNTPATGVPTVTGTVRVGEMLTAVTTGIADADGLPDSFSYQWVRVVSGTGTDISGATASTYTLVGADDGNTVKVEVSFTDDAGNAEGPLTSAVTGSVASPLLSVADASGTEGGNITFTATLSAASAKTVTATWTASVASGDTATSGDLGSTLTGTLTFAAGDLTKTFTVATAEDTTDENDETFTVTLSNLSNATLTGGTAIGTITDNDGAAELRIADASAAEGSAITFTVTLVPASAQTVTVNYATSVATGDTATTGDFTASSGSLSFAPGDTEKTFTVATTGDTADEPDETFTVTLSGPANATLSDATAKGTITDNDDPPTLSVADASAEEGNAVSFTATLSAASGQTVTATWTASVKSGDTAASGDLTGTLSGSLTFAPGDLTKTFTVGTREDTTDEDDETFTVTLSSLSNATLTGGTAVGTINDDDEAPTLGVSDESASEGEIASFTATLSAVSGKTVTVNWTASVESGDTAESSDLEATRSGSLTFAPGDRTKTFTVGTTEDTTDEDNETFTVTLSGPSNATLSDATGRGTITDDDAAPTLSVADANAAEGDAVSFTATLSAASEKTVTATWTATRNTAESTDLTGALTGTLTFAAGDLTKTFTVATTEDTVDEDDETFTVALSGLSNATLTGGTATGTIEDDDDPPTVGVADARAEEGENVAFTATLSAASEKTVTVVWTASAEAGDTAEAGDLTGTLTARLSFAPGDLTKSFTVRTREDNVDEVAEESFTVTLSAPSNVTVPVATAAGTIADDDTTTLRVSGPASAVTEGGDAVFTVTLSLPNSRDIEAFYVTRSSGSDPATHTKDYVPFNEGDAESGNLAIAAGETTVTVTVTTVDDQLDESATERFELVVEKPQAGVSPNEVDLDFTQAGADTATADIADNDPQPVVELVLDPASIGENGGSTQVTARMAGTVRSDRETTVTALAVAVAPAVPGDFALSGSELQIAAGAAESTGTVTVTAVDNNTDAPDKSVTVSATVANARGATAPAAKTLPIADDEDSPTVTLALSESSISEAGGTSVLTATLSHPSSEPTTVTVLPQAGSFTLVPANGRLTIAAGNTAGTGSVTLTAVDNRTDAPDNELTVRATAANAQGVYDDADGIELTITDEDAAPTPMLVLSQTSIGEAGASATVRVTLTHPSSEATTVVVAAAGTVDRAAEFTLADATLTVAAGAEQSSGSATITATANDTDAPDQVVTVSGTASNSQGIDGDPDAVELTIADDDAAPTVTLALATNPIAEENGSTAVTASLSHPSSEATTVTVTAAAVAPTVPGDFAQSGSVLTIAAGDLESTGTVTVTAAPNFVDAADKTVRVSATAANTQGKAGDPANVNLTIADDDVRGFTWSPQTMNIEEAAAFRNYMVALTSQPTADMTVTIADPGGDLRFFDPVNLVGGTSMTLTFTPDNWSTTQEVGVSAIHDSDSRNEQIDLRHTGAGGDYQGYRDTYRVVVSDDDRTARKVILTVDPTGVEEGGGARQVTVTASLDGARRAEATAVTVTAGPGNADATDFTATPASFTLTIPAASTNLNGSERRTVTLTPASDDIDEDDETVRFSGTTTATVENSTTVLTVDPADVTIADDDTRGVTLSTATVSPGEGGSATYTVVLESAPTGQVTVTPAVTGNSDVTVTPATLTFTAVNWSRAQTVTVEAAEDGDAAGDTATVAHTVAGADYGANNVTAGRVAVTVTDNDERTLVLAPTSLRFDEGTSGTYTVALTAQPTGTVTVRPSVSDNPDVTVSPSSLRFTSTTWSTAQTVTVTARTDANGLEDRATVRHAISGADYGANGAVGPALPVTVNDVATTQLIALSVAPTSVPENGRRQTVRVTARVDGAARDTATVVNVQVIGKTASPTDFTASPSALTVTIAANRQEGSATFGLTGTADTLDEGVGETIEVRGTSPSGLDVEPAEVTIADDDGRGLTLSRSVLTVNEQGTGTYTVRLASQPTGPVTVTPAVKPGGSPDVSFTPARLDFTAVDWSRAQTVTVTAADDADGDNDEATLRHTASGGDYGDIEGGEVVVTVRDNDRASRSVQLSVNPLVVGEEDIGRTVMVTATLDGAARAAATDVALAVTGGTAVAVTDFAAVSGVTVTIPAQQLAGTATFRFEPVNDNVDEGLSETVVFGGTVTGLTVRTATLTIADDDGKGLELSQGPVTLTEEGSADYRVALATQPTGPVTVRVTVSGDRDVTVDPASLSFAADTWETAQTVTVTAAHDDDAANDTAELRHAASGADYGGVRALPLAVAVTDNDTRGVTVSETAVSFREGARTTWTVVLDTRPSGTVRVTPALAAGSDADVTVTPSSLSFTTSSWSRAQTVTVRAAHDLDKLADSATVEHAVSGADYGENSVTADDVGVTVTDDDVPSTAIALSVAPATVREGASATRLTVTAELDASPEAAATEVTLSLAGLTATSGTDFQAVDPVTLTLPAGQVRATARITLTPVRDAIDEGDGETVRIGAVNASSGSTLRLDPSALEVTIADDDTRGVTLSRSALAVREEGSASWTVRLTSAPEGGDVTVRPTVTGNPDVTVAPASLTFTAADWSRAQTVTASAADDADGDDETAVVEHRVSGADYGANTVTVPDLPVSVDDNDRTSRSVQLSVAPLVVEEGGGGATVMVTATLDGAARAAATDVALAVTGGTAVAVTDFAAVSGVTVTIPAQQLAGTATFRFEPVNDNVDEGLSETVVFGGTVTGLTVRTATLTIADDDGKGLELSQGPVTLTEEGSADYRVALATQPTGPVTVRVTVSGDRDVTVDPASLSFAADTWETAQTVTVTAAHDDDAANDTAELRHAASGADYGGVRALPLAVAVTDNDTRGVTVSETAVSFREGARTTWTVVLDTRPSGTVRVTPALAAGSDADVTVTPSSLSFTTSSWSRAQTVTVRAAHDLDKLADSATVEHAVSGADYGENSVTADDVGVTVTDDDVPSTAIALSVAPATVREGASATRLTVTAELDASPEAAATEVTLSLAGLTATSGTDFQAVDPVTLTLPAGQVRATARITLTPVRDAIDEGDGETVRIGAVNASSGSTLRLDPSALEVTIADDDTRGVTLSRSALAVREEGSASWTVRLTSAPEGGDVTVRPTVTGNPDVTVAPASLTFTAADWSRAQTVTASAADDADGDDETAVVEHRVSGADYGANTVTVPDLPVSVDDNDRTSRSVQLSVAPLVVEEGGGGATVMVTATLDGAARAAATDVALAVTGGTAVAVTDFAAVSGVTVTIPAQQLAGTATFRFEPVNDNVDEGLSETVVFGGTVTGLTVRTATLTIADDDGKGLELSQGPVTLTEEGSADYRVALATQPTGPVTVRVTVSGDRDVTVDPASLSFAADTWETAQTVTVTAAHDDDAANDTAELRHAASGADYGGVRALPLAVAVTDNDTRGVTVSETAVSFREGARTTWTVVLDTRPSGTVRVTPALAAGSDADVTVTPSSLSFTTSSWSRAQTVTVRAAHDLDKLADSATVEHAVSGADYGENSVTADDVGVTVTDDDVPSTAIALSVAPATVREGASATRLTVTAELDASPEAAATEVTLSLAGLTATSGTDFQAVDPVTLTLPAGQVRATARITLTPVRDAIDEGDGETVRIGAVNASSGSTLRLDPSALEVTIADDDTRGVTLSRSALAVREEGSASWTVRLTSAPEGGDVTVRPTVTGNPDVTVAPASLTFTAADWSRAQTVTASAADDADGDDETAVVEHRVSGADYGANTVTVPDLPVSVDDNDRTSRSVQLSVAPLVVEEGGGGATVMVTATLDGAARAAATDVALAVTGGTAVAVTDFAAVSGVTVTIPAQQLAGTATFRFEPVNDNVDEGLSETVVFGGTVTGLTVRTATLTIADDDGKGLELSQGPVTLTEEGSADYRVALATQPTGPVTVRVTVSGDRDVTVDPASLSFAADTWETAQTVTVTAAHDDDAANDTAELRHAASGADYGGVRALPLAVAVTDNDTRGVTVSETAVSFREGARTTWTVVLDTRPSGTVRVTPALAAGSDADVTVTPSSLSFTTSSWSRAQTVTVRAAHDLDKLADSATVEHAVSGADYGENSVTADDVGVTVTDDDVPSTAIALSVAPATVREGASATRLTVTAELDASPEAAATEVTLSLAGLTATSGTDFQAVDPVTLTLPAGQVRATARITLTPVRDAIDEGDGETVRIGAVNASSGSTLRLDPSALEVTIADDDTRGVTLSRSALAVREEGSASWTVRLTSAPEGGDVTVRPTVTGNPDVTVAPASLTFTAADWSRAQTVTASAADDADGDDETAVVEHRVSGADYGANTVTVPDLPVSVDDNDRTSRSVQLSVAPLVVEEGGGGATVMVTATLDGAARAAATDVALAVTGGTAVAVTDFAAVSGVTVTIPAQQLAGTATFRFEPVNDNVDEGLSETVVFGGTVTGLTVRTATLTIADDDGKGLELSQGPVTLTEEGSADYRVALATQPTGPVTVRVTVSGDRDVTVDPASLSFAADTWETAQTVTVTAAHDDDAANDTAELRHAASGADYGGVRALPLAVAVTDNDTRGVTLSETALSFDEGGSATYTVVLDTRPSGTVRVRSALATGSDADVTVTPSSLSFTTSNWSRAQTMTVRAGEDADRANDSATVGHAVSGADYGEHGVTAASLPVTAIDSFSAPDAPTALTATPFGRNRIDLAWTAPPADAGGRGITGYQIEVSADRGATWSVLAADTGTDSTAYAHAGLDFGATRHYRVSTINRLGSSPPSNVVSATTDARPVVTFSHRAIPNENGDGSLSPVPKYEVTVTSSQPVRSAAGELRSQAVLTGGRFMSSLSPVPATNQLSGYYTEWKAELVPSGPIQGGPVTTTLTIPQNALRDREGRLSRANTLRIESELPNQDKTQPQVVIRPGEAGYADGPFTVDVEFNEPVTGFVQSELRVANGRVTAWEPQEGGEVYRATVRPDTPSGETIEVTFNVPAGAARDGGGNDSVEAAPLTVPARPRPTVTVTATSRGNQGDKEVTVTFSRPVTGFTENELIIQKPTYAENYASIGAARVTTFTANANGLEYVFVVRPTRLGYVETTVRANVANDAEGYPNLATHSYKVINLTAIPQGLQRGLRAEPDPLVAAFRGAPANHDGTGAFALQLAFDGAIAGDADDVRDAITVTNGGLTAIARDKKESRQWNLTVTPSSTSEVTVEIAASAPCDEDGALCTADGRRLEAGAETTIAGPASIGAGPSILRARLVTGPGTNGSWDVDETVTAEVTFSAAVMVQGFPILGVTLDGARREAAYASGTGTAVLRFSHPVTAADAGATEARLVANGFDTSNGTIGDNGGRRAVLDFAVAPYVTAVAVLADASGDGQWSAGEKIEAQLTFSETVTVTGGTPSVGVTAGAAAKTAPYASGSGTASLVFAWPVTEADGTVTQAALTADSLALNGAGLSAAATGVAAETGHGGAERAASTLRTASVPADAAPMLSISDARAVEGVDASMTFTVTLAPASSGPVTANYATGGGSATEGQDYTGVYGRLRFAPGETSKTIEVAVLDDDYDEGEETFHLVLYQADGADIADGAGQGTIANTDAMPAAWLARFGRTVSDQVLDAVEARLRASRAAGVTVRLGGQTLGSARQAEADESDGKRAELEADERQKPLSDWLKGETRDGDWSRTLAGREVLMGSSFALAATTDGGGFASVWGRMAQSRFAGSEETLRLDGEVTTGLLGADYAGGPWTGGVVLSHSRGDGDYRGKGSGRTEASLTVVTPWAGYAVSERVSLWGALGYGEGDVTLTPTDQTGQETDIAMTLAATGARGALLQGGGPKLDAVADARWVRTSSERVSSGEGNLEATSADVTRLSLGLEGAWALALGDGATLTPRLALGGRHDGGDAETGFGVDIGGGMALALPARGLTLSLQGRGLLSHAASGFRDSGFSGHIGWDSKPASEHGLTLSLRQTVGSSASGGGQALFSREVMENLGANDNGSARRLEAKLGYGFPAFGDRFTSTPELGLGLSNGQREISLGWRLNMAGPGDPRFSVDLEATRREAANDDAKHGVALRAVVRW